jgi:hypothetical protein
MNKKTILWLCMMFLIPAAEAGNRLRLSIVNTSSTVTLDAFTYAGGSWFATTKMNHMAVLIEHPQGRFLFDTGLGRDIDYQYAEDMPWWMKPMMKYDPANSVRDQFVAVSLNE